MDDTFDIRSCFDERPVLDLGYVALFDGMVTHPMLKVVNAARVSFLKESKTLSPKDEGLIRYLIEHEHFSTLRHSYFSFRIKAPICVFRQWWKYQVGSDWMEEGDSLGGNVMIPDTSWNEASFRYVEPQAEFYIPEVFRKQSKDNKQGSEGVQYLVDIGGGMMVRTKDHFRNACQTSFENYQVMVRSGVAKEQARMVLPSNTYSECIWTCSLQTILHFLHQRLKEDAQWEIRQYAKAVLDLVRPLLLPGLVAEPTEGC